MSRALPYPAHNRGPVLGAFGEGGSVTRPYVRRTHTECVRNSPSPGGRPRSRLCSRPRTDLRTEREMSPRNRRSQPGLTEPGAPKGAAANAGLDPEHERLFTGRLARSNHRRPFCYPAMAAAYFERAIAF